MLFSRGEITWKAENLYVSFLFQSFSVILRMKQTKCRLPQITSPNLQLNIETGSWSQGRSPLDWINLNSNIIDQGQPR